MTRDLGSHTEADAANFERSQAWQQDDREHDDGPSEATFEHVHGEGLICLKCIWLRARREHLGLVADAETEWCERCADEYPVVAGCLHGQILCGRCRHFCGECRDDIADAASDSLRDRLRGAWGGGDAG